MMRFQDFKQDIQDLCRKADSIVGSLETLAPGPGDNMGAWKRDLDIINDRLDTGTVRVAIVGSIKSGKSTLVNALIGNDHLKRGAGVVTSIVTRVRSGSRLAARLFFKSWEEINQEIERALILLPSDNWRSRQGPFDIRRKQDRQDLAQALNDLDRELQVLQDSLNANAVLLKAYLEGFQTVRDMVASDNGLVEYVDDDFHLHRDFVGRDALAVYLKDLLLVIDNGRFGDHIEFADCQGSDSPNPLHLAMIQDYLLVTHLVVYVISSRMGLREADIRFLSMLKRMGMVSNLVFVLNCDIGEHTGVEELAELESKVREQLALMIDNPRLFTFSALYRLLDANSGQLDIRDERRLEQWRLDQKLVASSEEAAGEFFSFLEETMNTGKYALLLSSQLKRLEVLLGAMAAWINLHQDLAKRDRKDVAGLLEKISGHQDHMRQIRTMINSTIDGTSRKIKSRMKMVADRFFEAGDNSPAKAACAFVDSYRADVNQYRQSLEQSGFTATVYLVFQEIRQAVDRFLTENINPEIIKFIREAEVELASRLQQLSDPYRLMIRQAIKSFGETLTPYGLGIKAAAESSGMRIEIKEVKQVAGLELPPARANLRYSANIKTEAVMRLGFYTAVRIFRQVFKKDRKPPLDQGVRALAAATNRMKKEIKRSLVAQFKDYRENVKFQYLVKLVDASAARQKELMSDQFDTYLTDLSQTMDAMAGTRQDRDRYVAALGNRAKEVERLLGRLQVLDRRLVELKTGQMAN